MSDSAVSKELVELVTELVRPVVGITRKTRGSLEGISRSGLESKVSTQKLTSWEAFL
jgi:hypothetical protein